MAHFDYYYYWNVGHYLKYIGNIESLDNLVEKHGMNKIKRIGGFATYCLRSLRPSFFRRMLGLDVTDKDKQTEYKDAFNYAIIHYESVS
ncbi:MAG TPA: hypothetical protein PLG47_02930 [Candidatus Dojkabacteria bacterium]|nr:hypothetical protein [Candidatus Dojkabacteria bacterium]